MTAHKKRIIGVAIITALILLVPLVAMQFTAEVNWDLFDFVFMGVLIFGTGLAYELVARKGSAAPYRAGVGFALAASFLLIWMNGAVGIIGSENNPANLLYAGVFAVLLIGAAVVRLEARGMARTLIATAITQALVPVVALIIWRPDFSPGIIGVFVLNAFFVVLFVLSALFFRRAARSAPRKPVIELIVRLVIRKGDRILLCKSNVSGHYYLPGGHVEFGDSLTDTIYKEMKEELGAERNQISGIAYKDFLEQVFIDGEKKRHELNMIFSAEVSDDLKAESKEGHIGFEWVPFAEIGNINLLPKAIIPKL